MNNLGPILTPSVSNAQVVDSPSVVSSNENFLPSIIVQLNCHNSRATTYSILNSEPVSVFSLILQEPWINPLKLLPPDHEAWWTFYSPDHQPTDLKDKHRVVTYVRKSLASQNIRVLGGNSKFFIGLELTLLTGTQLRALNVYNPPGTMAGLDHLEDWLNMANNRRIATIVGMDSNLHHRNWNPPGYSHVHEEAKSLVSMCGRHGFRLASEKDVPTFVSSRGSRTTIDLTWANFLASRLIQGTATSSENHGSDHQKLSSILRQSPLQPEYRTVAP
jgi:hypothetical protein